VGAISLKNLWRRTDLTNAMPPPGRTIHGGRIHKATRSCRELVYRRIGNRESVVAVHFPGSILHRAAAEVRWYELPRSAEPRVVVVYQPRHLRGGLNFYRWDGEPGDRSSGATFGMVIRSDGFA
jgi:hypothetical protein